MSKDKIFIFLILGLIIVGFYFSGLPRYFIEKRGEFLITSNIQEPVYSKAIYITFQTAASKRMNDLIELVKTTELNSVVIDIKDYSGRIPFNTESDLINKFGSEKIYIKDIKELINKLHKEGIY